MFQQMVTTTSQLAQRANNQLLLLASLLTVMVLLPDIAQAGTSAIFDDLGTEADSAVFGPLGQTVIAFAAVGGAIFAIIKGAFMLAGLGIAVAGLMYAANIVIGSAAFGALI